MADDIVKLAESGIDVTDGHMLEGYVGKPERRDYVPAILKLSFRKVYTRKATLRQVKSHRYEIAATGTAQFEYPGISEIGCVNTEKAGQCVQVFRVGFLERVAEIGYQVVSVLYHVPELFFILIVLIVLILILIVLILIILILIVFVLILSVLILGVFILIALIVA